MNKFEKQAHHLLRESERAVDDQVLERLAEARSLAVSHSARKKAIPSFLLPAAGMALASVAAIVLVVSPLSQQAGISDEVLLNENIEFYEDLDFYQWLAEDDTRLKG